MRPSRDELYLEMAQLIATRGTCPRKQVGAVIVQDKRVISMGYNGAPPGMAHCLDVGCGGARQTADNDFPDSPPEYPYGCTRAIHAEQNAVNFCARHGVSSDDAAMYSTCATCATCAMSLVAAGISRFVYIEPYRIPDGLVLLRDAGLEVVQWTP